jgi:RsiW-degrading membrane proteinase PrsW (M82 family)
VENLFVLGNSFSVISTASISLVTTTLLLRFIGATLLHSISSALVGFYWAKGKLLQKRRCLFIGIIFATIIHGIFNYLIEYFQDKNLLIYPSIFLLFALFFCSYDFEKLKKRGKINILEKHYSLCYTLNMEEEKNKDNIFVELAKVRVSRRPSQ